MIELQVSDADIAPTLTLADLTAIRPLYETAFSFVSSSDWRGPISKEIHLPGGEEGKKLRKLIGAAVIFFTGSIAKFTDKATHADGSKTVLVTARGYRNVIGS